MAERTLRDLVGEGRWASPPGAPLCPWLRSVLDDYAGRPSSPFAVEKTCQHCHVVVTVRAGDGLLGVATAHTTWTRQGDDVDGRGIWVKVTLGGRLPPPTVLPVSWKQYRAARRPVKR